MLPHFFGSIFLTLVGMITHTKWVALWGMIMMIGCLIGSCHGEDD